MPGPTFSYGSAYPTLKPTAAAAAPAGGDDLIKETTTATFMADVIDASMQVPVLVDFWAEWCGPCKQLTPVIEKVVRGAKGRVKLVKMNIDHHPEVAGQMGIRSIPAVIAFKGGQPIDGFMGAVPESQILTFIDKICGPQAPSSAETLVVDGQAALAAGDLQTAIECFAEAHQAEPENLEALLGLADVHVASRDLDTAKKLLATVPAAQAKDPRVAAVQARIALAETTAALGDPVALEARLAHDANDHQARFDLALILAATDHRQAAVDSLIEIIRRDRPWNDEGARKQLLTFFEAWGPKDPATLYGRRRLSSVLFS
jgi:putative thioredoxin